MIEIFTIPLWLIAMVAVWWVTRSATERRVQKELRRHQHIYDTVTVDDLPSQWEGMIASLKPTKAEEKTMRASYATQLTELTQPRKLVTASCACGDTRVVLVYGKKAEMATDKMNVAPMLGPA